jgi:hypothetical protein
MECAERIAKWSANEKDDIGRGYGTDAMRVIVGYAAGAQRLVKQGYIAPSADPGHQG